MQTVINQDPNYLYTTPAGTPVYRVQKNGKGWEGTIIAMDDHAELPKPLAQVIKATVEQLPFKLWRQGHAVHYLKTSDGREYKFKGMWLDGQPKGHGYVGIELREVFKDAAGKRHIRPVMQIIDMEDALAACTYLKNAVRPRLAHKFTES